MPEAAPTFRLFFVGTYSEIRDQKPGDHTHVFNKFGQEFVTGDRQLAEHLLSLRPGISNREGHFVTEQEFRSQFPGVPSPQDDGYVEGRKALINLLHTPGELTPIASETAQEVQQ